jgi:hypothetical protein
MEKFKIVIFVILKLKLLIVVAHFQNFLLLLSKYIYNVNEFINMKKADKIILFIFNKFN